MKIGCQTFTWEMLEDHSSWSTESIVAAIGDAGYQGIEITSNMIGRFERDPDGFRQLLADNSLAFIAYAFSTSDGFTVAAKADDELEQIDAAMDFLAEFPGTILSLGCPTDHHGVGDAAAIEVAASIFNRAGALGRNRGVPVAFHPSSHHGSVVVNRAQYEAIMRATDPALVKWVPDTGHIVRGSQVVVETLTMFEDRIAYVHLKDASPKGWMMMGSGLCDIPGVISHLRDRLGFDGWLVAEEEAEEAGRDPGAAVAVNRKYLSSLIQ